MDGKVDACKHVTVIGLSVNQTTVTNNSPLNTLSSTDGDNAPIPRRSGL